MSKVAIVAPCHIQPSEEWVDALWHESEASGAHVIIVDDSDGKITLPWLSSKTGDVYSYAKQKEAMGEELYAAFEQFHKSSACKQFGLWKAYKDGYDVVIVIDSDCVVPKGFVAEHIAALALPAEGWENPLADSGWFSRGFPYSQRALKKWAHMGLWTEMLDLYGTDRVANKGKKEEDPKVGYLTTGAVFPLSGMNVTFKREAIPFMLFLPNFSFRDKNFSRHDDIWGGYIFQKIAKQNGAGLSYGKPYVKHVSPVIAEEDAEAEVAMITYEDRFYDLIDHALVFNGSGCDGFSAPEIFSWLAREMANSTIFAALAPVFDFWAKSLE